MLHLGVIDLAVVDQDYPLLANTYTALRGGQENHCDYPRHASRELLVLLLATVYHRPVLWIMFMLSAAMLDWTPRQLGGGMLDTAGCVMQAALLKRYVTTTPILPLIVSATFVPLYFFPITILMVLLGSLAKRRTFIASSMRWRSSDSGTSTYRVEGANPKSQYIQFKTPTCSSCRLLLSTVWRGFSLQAGLRPHLQAVFSGRNSDSIPRVLRLLLFRLSVGCLVCSKQACQVVVEGLVKKSGAMKSGAGMVFTRSGVTRRPFLLLKSHAEPLEVPVFMFMTLIVSFIGEDSPGIDKLILSNSQDRMMVILFSCSRICEASFFLLFRAHSFLFHLMKPQLGALWVHRLSNPAPRASIVTNTTELGNLGHSRGRIGRESWPRWVLSTSTERQTPSRATGDAMPTLDYSQLAKPVRSSFQLAPERSSRDCGVLVET